MSPPDTAAAKLLSRDESPLLMHSATLVRTCGMHASVPHYACCLLTTLILATGQIQEDEHFTDACVCLGLTALWSSVVDGHPSEAPWAADTSGKGCEDSWPGGAGGTTARCRRALIAASLSA